MKTRFIQAQHLHPGQEFLHFGQEYRRATDEEARRHPCRDNQVKADRPLVFCYQGTMPLAFVPDVAVVVTARSRKGGGRA